MKPFHKIFLIGMIFLVHSCTGQKPAPLKNSTTPKHYVKAACSSMIIEGQVLSKKNVLNIFECSGWDKKLPELTRAIENSEQEKLDSTFKVLNDAFFKTKEQRKTFFELASQSQINGEMRTFAELLQRSLRDHSILSQVDNALNSEGLDKKQQSSFMKVLSNSNKENIKAVRALKNISKAFEANKKPIIDLLNLQDRERLISDALNLFEDFSRNMDDKSLKHLANIVHNGDSAIQQWATQALYGDLRVLLNIIEEPGFYSDISFLRKSIDHGIKCLNRSNSVDFTINVGQELNHKIDSLKTDSRDEFEKVLLHGLTKYLAFQEFCEEKNRQQGLDSFLMVLKHAFNVILSQHDYSFLRDIHKIFKEDRFVFLSFLTSQSFAALRELLIDLNSSGQDTEFVSLLYEIAAKINPLDIEVASELIHNLTEDGGQTKEWFHSWKKLWSSLSKQEKHDFIAFISLFLEEGVDSSLALSLIEKLMLAFPDFTPSLAMKLKEKEFQSGVRYLIKISSDRTVQNELSVFLSNEGLFEFIAVLTKNSKTAVRPEVLTDLQPLDHEVNYIERIVLSRDSQQTRACFNSLTETYMHDSSYYSLVNTLPEHCLRILGRVGFVGQIYLWMNSSDSYFREVYQVSDFHSATGVWAPGMLQFIFSAAVDADMTLLSENGTRGLKDNLNEVHRVLTHEQVLNSFHTFSKVYLHVNTDLAFDSKLLSFLNTKNDKEMNQLVHAGLTLIKGAETYVELPPVSNLCDSLSSDLGVNPCLSKVELTDGVTDVLRFLKRKNERGNSLIQELVKWLHPKGGINLPIGKSNLNHKATLDETIRFFHDLSSTGTIKEFAYHTAEGRRMVEGTILDRLEVVIRDINIVNNFYGAFFKNEIADASDYRKDVSSNEKLLKILDRTSGMFRATGGLPKESKYLLKNVRNTYGSLIELSDNFKQADGTDKSYGMFIQGLLAAVVTTSKVETQKFNAYRIPDEKIVEGHNGLFLTKIVQMSGLRHMSQYVRSRFDKDLSALYTEDFRMINSNLVGRHKLSRLQSAFQSMLDRYLDAGRHQVNILIEDALGFIFSVDATEQKHLEEIALKALVLLSSPKIDQENVELLGKVLDLSIESWPEIRQVLLSVKDRKALLKGANRLMDSLLKNPEELNSLVNELRGAQLFNDNDFRRLLQNKLLLNDLAAFVNNLVEIQDFKTSLNWHETFQAIFSQPDTRWEALKSWFQVALGEDKNKLTLSLLIEFLGEKNSEGYRLKNVMDELFLNHRSELNQFLEETFKSLELKPD